MAEMITEPFPPTRPACLLAEGDSQSKIPPMDPQLLWPLPSAEKLQALRSIAPGQVHLWVADLDQNAYLAEIWTRILSASEVERAARFRFDVHRHRFMAGRTLLRLLLGWYLRLQPAALEFVAGDNGKPALRGAAGSVGIQFNLSHSGNVALFGVALGHRIGVDVERLRLPDDAGELVRRFFSAREGASFQQLEPAAKPAAFFNLWTRKEAWLKATGEGIGRLLHRVEVSFVPGRPAALTFLPAELGNLRDWTLLSSNPAEGFVSAAAVEGEVRALECFALTAEWLASPNPTNTGWRA